MVSGARRRHFRVFDAWQKVLGEAQMLAEAQHPQVTTDVYSRLFGRAIKHCATQLDSGGWGIGRIGAGGYVARQDRRDFFEQMHGLFTQFVAPDYVRPRGFAGIKFDLTHRGEYRFSSMLDPVNRLKNAVQRSHKPDRARQRPARSL